MPRISIELDLPDDVAEKALKYGKLTSEAVREMISRAVADYPEDDLREEFDPRLAGAAAPELLGRGKILGDLDEPLDVVWEACGNDRD